MLSIPERLGDQTDLFKRMMDAQNINLRVAMPGIVQSFDAASQTATVQVAIRERVLIDGNEDWTEIPLLVDVPLATIRAGGYLLAPSVSPGDECWVWFADCCYDAAWQSGGVQNQVDRRRHDLSDAFFMPSLFSQSKRISNYPTQGIQLRNDAGSAVIEITGNTININAGNINIGPDATIGGRSFLNHTHGGVQSGGGKTGGVT